MSELDELAEMLDAVGIEYEEMSKRRWTLRSLHWQTDGGHAAAYEYPDGRLMLSTFGGMFASSGTIAALAVKNRKRKRVIEEEDGL